MKPSFTSRIEWLTSILKISNYEANRSYQKAQNGLLSQSGLGLCFLFLFIEV